jgi:phage terminase large subunit
MSTGRRLEQIERAIGGAAADGAVLYPEYAERPADFARDVLGVELTEIQRGMLQAIVEHDRTAMACGHRTGRTLVFAVALLWHCATRADATALLSTPSQAQMRWTVWRELGELVRGAIKPLGAECFELPGRGVQFANGNLIIGVASDTGERLQGYASPALLVVVDEAAGFPEHLFPALMSNLAGGGKVVIGGNPTNNSGYFAKRWKAPGWHTMHVSSVDVANSPDRKPGQATAAWVADMLEENGVDSIIYRARVLGQFSAADAASVFSLVELEQAQDRYDEAMAASARAFDIAGPLELGLDVARTGNDWTVVVARRGPIALAPVAWKLPDLVVVAEQALAYARDLKRIDERPTIRVDGVGVGAGVVDILKRAPDINVVEVQAAGTPARDAFTNVRSEAVFVCRDWLRAGGCLPRDAKLEGEMAALKFTFDQRNRLKILGKDELRKELGRSTDRFDALALATYAPADNGIADYIRAMQVLAIELNQADPLWDRFKNGR